MFSLNKTYLYLILVLLTAIIGFFIQNFILTDDLLIDHLGRQLSMSRVEFVLDVKAKSMWLNFIILPLAYILKFALITVWILSGTIIFGYKNSFKEIFQVVIVAEFVWLIPSLITLVWFGFIDTNYTFDDVQYFKPLSLLSLFDPITIHSWLIYPLQSLNLFELVYMLVLAIGIKQILKKDYQTALGFTVPVYGTALLTWIVFITFLSINLKV
jgi:hypothetical protein